MMSVQTTEDGTDSSLPSFSTFTTELDPSWDYYDRDRSSSDVITQHNSSYTRPWEMETKEKGFEPFSKLPSFQSQFHSYGETNMMPEPGLPQVTPVPVPISPNSVATGTPGNGSLTQLTPIQLQNGLAPMSSPSFHTLTAVNSRPYPLVPAPIQARDIPAINQQYMDERHIQLYQPITTYAPQNVVTVLKSEPANYEMKNGLHHTSFQNPMLDNGFDNMKIENNHKIQTPIRNNDARKKERRKIRASSLESSAESESSAMEMNDGNPGQVAAISSTASFKSPIGSVGVNDEDTNGEKQVMHTTRGTSIWPGTQNPFFTSSFSPAFHSQTKKKRKRCGECIGCQKKDNCGDCAPCRNDKSHQICKQRRCEKLTDKKVSPHKSTYSTI